MRSVNAIFREWVDGAPAKCYNLPMQTIVELSKKYGINAEYASVAFYPVFRAGVAGCRVLLVSDENTCRYAAPFAEKLRGYGIAAEEFVLPAREPVADEATCAAVEARAKGACDYVLAVGAGTINDIVKYVTFRLGLPCGVLATAASMDGYASGVTPLIRKGVKVTESAHTIRDILIDTQILRDAPRIMTGAGVGDILAKYCCLTDWKLSSLLTGEALNTDAMALMRDALDGCAVSLPNIRAGGVAGLNDLMRALLVSGYAMVIAGNSRPASGAEHHMSHYLEMDFLRRGKPIPLHGVKVGLGTLVSLHLYKRVAALAQEFAGKEIAAALAVPLPSPEWAAEQLASFGCPTRFSEIGVPEETFRAMLLHAHELRDRFTILTLYNRNGLTEGMLGELTELFY